MAFKTLTPFFLLLLIKSSYTQWLNCSQVEFCERLRHQPRNNSYLLHSLSASHDSVSALIEGTSNSTYNLTLHILSGGLFRIIIDDVRDPRHRVLDVLDGEPQKADLNVTDYGNIYEITSYNAKVILYPDPVELFFIWKDEVVAVVDTNRLVFEDEPNGAIALEFLFLGAQVAYGLPEHADHISLRETVNLTNPYRLYNIDNYGYDTESTQALYGSVPVLYAHSTNRASGVFWQNSAQTFVEIERRYEDLHAYFISESGVIDFFILTGPTFRDAVRQYANLTGKPYKSNDVNNFQL